MKEKITLETGRLAVQLENAQSRDGSWNFCYESGIMTDAYMIILLRTLQHNDELLIKKLVDRIKSKQDINGMWKLYHDETSGNLSATVEAYFALLFSG